MNLLPGEPAPRRPSIPGLLYALLDPGAGPAPRFAATAVCLLAGAAAVGAEQVGAPGAVTWALVAVAFVAGGLRTTLSALEGMRSLRPDVNFLMILAALASAAMGHWGEGVVLLFLFSLSDALERFALERTKRGIRALMKLRPDTAHVMRGGEEVAVRVEDVRPGEVVRVRPGERFPIDGELIDGRTAVDESIVTGESLPIDKEPGDAILAGTINATGSVLVRMTKPAAESTLARIIRLVQEAQEQRTPWQRVVDRWQTPYVIGVLLVSVLTILIERLVGKPLGSAVYSGMVMLVAASPCAVVLASPAAILAAVARGARFGVLFKGGTHIERLAAIDTLALDKTGTITRGVPALDSVTPAPGTSGDDLLALAAALERHSRHPLARAVVAAADARKLPEAEVLDFESASGFGLFGHVDGEWVGVGRPELFERCGHALPAEVLDALAKQNGATPVVVWTSRGRGGVLGLRDEIRPEARDALALLHGLGIRRVVMLTGDHVDVARHAAARLEIDEYRAGLKPEDKLNEIRRLAAQSGGVAMVGDGVNDAPALAAATVGVAMGGGGSDVALETADVVLMRDDLRSLAEAVHLARHTTMIIRQSLAIAIGMIVVLMVSTLLDVLSLPLAVVGHEGSTVVVILNGLRLLRLHAVHTARPAAHPAESLVPRPSGA